MNCKIPRNYKNKKIKRDILLPDLCTELNAKQIQYIATNDNRRLPASDLEHAHIEC